MIVSPFLSRMQSQRNSRLAIRKKTEIMKLLFWIHCRFQFRYGCYVCNCWIKKNYCHESSSCCGARNIPFSRCGFIQFHFLVTFYPMNYNELQCEVDLERLWSDKFDFEMWAHFIQLHADNDKSNVHCTRHDLTIWFGPVITFAFQLNDRSTPISNRDRRWKRWI